MSNNLNDEEKARLKRRVKYFDKTAFVCLVLFWFLFLYAAGVIFPSKSDVQTATTIDTSITTQIDSYTLVKDSIHVLSGLKADKDYELVLQNCGGCHSYKLVIQNNADSAGWTSTIRWMQKTQKLWDLGKNEAKIIAYLSKNYGAKKTTRRANLQNVEWYKLE